MIILPANTLSTGFDVANSCRFNDGDSPRCQKDLADGHDTAATISLWFKRCTDSAAQTLFECYEDSSNYFRVRLEASNEIQIRDRQGGSDQLRLKTSALIRDPSAWYSLIIVIDTTDGTAADRCKVYINGTRVTAFGTETTYGSSDTIETGNADSTVNVGGSGASDNYLDGYLAEVVFLDGVSQASSGFGEFDEDSPTIWKPIDVSGLTFGTNGFYLDFEDSSNLGNDANGGTDLTEANLAATDQSTDSPTNNFCTLNPLDKHSSASLAEGNLDLSTTANGWFASSGTQGITLGSGPWYFEAKAITETRLYFGLSRIGQGVRGECLNDAAEGSSDFDYMWRVTSANNVYYGGSDQSITITAISANDICACHVATDGEVKFYKNDSLVVTFSTKLVAGYTYFPIISANAFSDSPQRWQANFGNPPYANSSSNADPDGYGAFEYATKSGYALCTKNLGAYGG